jgi:threonine synthase
MSKKKEEVSKEEQLKTVKDAIKKEKASKTQSAHAALATRELLEKDYKEDTFYVEFRTASGKLYKTKATKPSNNESSKILRLAISAAKAEGSDDPEDLLKIQKIQDDLAQIAGKLALDESLNEDFWANNVSSQTLINFVVGIVTSSQGVSDEELRKFR